MVKEVTIYGLHAPGGPIRYIGKTKRSLRRRLIEHISNAKNRDEDSQRGHWIRELLRAGQKPEMVVLERVSEDNWQLAERKRIAFYREAGFDVLNGDDGGWGGSTNWHADSRNGQCKLTEEQVIELCEEYATGDYTQAELANKYGVSTSNIGFIVAGRTWEDIERPISEGDGRAKLTTDDVREIRRLYVIGDYSQRELGERFGVTQAEVGNIVRGEIWKDIPGAVDKRGQVRGECHPQSKLTEATVKKIRKVYATGQCCQRELAEKFGVSRGAISLIVRRKTWTHL